MAKINNAQVIQKLVDELKLYPGKDLIPSELADKILAVYQINDQSVNVSVSSTKIVKTAGRTTAGTSVIFTTPATGKFFLTNIAISAAVTTTDELIYSALINVVIDATTVELARVNLIVDAGTQTSAAHDTQSLNLQNPIELDPGSVINFVVAGTPSLGIDGANASIVGYTEED